MQKRLGFLAAATVVAVCTVQLLADVPALYEPYFTELPRLNQSVDVSSFANMQPRQNVTSTFAFTRRGVVNLVNPKTGQVISTFAPLGSGFTDPVTVVPFAFRNNATADTLFAGPERPSDAPFTGWALTSPPQLLGQTPDDSMRRGGLRILAGNVFGDWQPELVLASGPGGPNSMSLLSLTREEMFGWGGFPENDQYTGGFFLAGGDFNGDGFMEILASAEQAAKGEVFMFDFVNGRLRMRGCGYSYGPDFRGGVRVAAGDFNLDGKDDIATVPTKGPAHVRVYNVTGPRVTVLADWVINEQPFFSDIRIGTTTIDGIPRLVVGTDGRLNFYQPTPAGRFERVPSPFDPNGPFGSEPVDTFTSYTPGR